MAEKELEDYIKVQKSLGVNDESIRKSLLGAGYDEEEFRHILARHSRQSREISISNKNLLRLNVAVVLAFCLLFIYITYDYNDKIRSLSELQKESTANLSSQFAGETGSIRSGMDIMGRSLGNDINQTRGQLEGRVAELDTSTKNYNYQAMIRDSSLSDSIQKMSSKSTSELSSFGKQLETFRESTVDFGPIIPDAIDAVVTIGKKGEGYFTTAGSGVIINNEGYIVTNYHVVDRLSKITVKTHDGGEYTATLVGKDEAWDIAVLKAVTERKDFSFLQFADSSKATVGQHIIAVGNPVGFESTVTEGIISNTNRKISNGKETYYIQTDVAINAGNSGGPLIDKDGKIVGIATLKYAGTGFEGLSFALLSNDVQGVVLAILEKEVIK